MAAKNIMRVLVDLSSDPPWGEVLWARLSELPGIQPIRLLSSCDASSLPDLVVSCEVKRIAGWRKLGLHAMQVSTLEAPAQIVERVVAQQQQWQPVSASDLLPDVSQLQTLGMCEQAIEQQLRQIAVDLRYRRACVMMLIQLPNEEEARCRSFVACLPDLADPQVVFNQHSLTLTLDEMQALTTQIIDAPESLHDSEFVRECRDALLTLLPDQCQSCWGNNLHLVAPGGHGAIRVLLLLGSSQKPTHQQRRFLEVSLAAIVGRWESLLLQQFFSDNSSILDHAREQPELGTWTWDLNQDELTLYNGLCAVLGGVNRQRSCSRQEWEQRIHPGDMTAWRTLADQASAAERPLSKTRLRILGFDSEWHWVSIQARRAIDADGDPAPLISGTLQDMTYHHEVETLGNKLITAVEQTGESIMITNADNIIEYVNPAFSRMSGYRRAECIGKPAGMLASGQHGTVFYRDMWETLGRGQTWSGILTNRRKDGTLYEEESSISQILDEYGEGMGYVAVKRDLSAELEQERQLQHAQRMESVGRVAGGLVHDFNNLLMGIMLFSDFALQEVEKDSPFYHQIEEIQKATRHASELIRKLMTISRKEQYAMEPLLLNEVLDHLQVMVRRLAGEKVELQFDTSGALQPIKGDAQQLQQLVLNLVINARDAMDEEGTLTLSTSRSHIDTETARRNALSTVGWYNVLVITDTGCGISPDMLDTIFEPFFTTKPKGRGTGLGLATVYSICQQHGGLIKVESTVDVGTTFRIFLPEAESLEGLQPASDAPISESGSGTVLVVEDEPLAREMLIEILQRTGYHVYAAGDGHEAMTVAESLEAPVDLLLSDVVMPGPNGPTVYRQLKEKWPALRVLFISGYAYDQFSRQEIQGLEGEPFLSKPFSMPELAAAIRGIL